VANEKGLKCLLLVGATATAPATYTKLEGQTDTSFDGTVNMADTTDKDSGDWVTGLATTRSGTISVSGNLKTPRPMWTLLQTAWSTGGTHGCKIALDTAGAGWTGEFYVSSLTVSGATSDMTTYSMTLTPAGALTANVVT
jgi:predicted secreted protein